MKEHHNWGWPIACYLFLGGLGGGMIVLSGLADLLFGRGDLFAMGSLIAGVAIAVGSGLLIFELGRPSQFWRVLSRQRAIMTAGAWMLSITIATSFAYFSFWPEFSPWHELVGLRHVIAGINILLGLGVCVYTGILLGSLRARAFWNTPILPILFLISGLSTGAAAQALMAGAWPYTGNHADVKAAHAALQSMDVVLIAFEVMVILLYVLMLRCAAGTVAARIASSWLTGNKSFGFWAGLVVCGLVGPALLYLVSSATALIAAPILVLIGGLILRFLVVFSDERIELPGEHQYYSRLPKPDAPFLKAWD